MKGLIFYIFLVIVTINAHPLKDINQAMEDTFVEFDLNTYIENEENIQEMTMDNFDNNNEIEKDMDIFNEKALEDELKSSETGSTFSPLIVIGMVTGSVISLILVIGLIMVTIKKYVKIEKIKENKNSETDDVPLESQEHVVLMNMNE